MVGNVVVSLLSLYSSFFVWNPVEGEKVIREEVESYRSEGMIGEKKNKLQKPLKSVRLSNKIFHNMGSRQSICFQSSKIYITTQLKLDEFELSLHLSQKT